MIKIEDKQSCCGCHACSSVCAKGSISMQSDEEGFLYPVVDTDTCTNCGLCEKVCPIINQREPSLPLVVYAAKNRNEDIRHQSSSGGIFTLLAEEILSADGVVFGAKFDSYWNIVHDYTETIAGLAPFRGSKYVQSTIGDNYKRAKEFLVSGRKVLFSGTPCQIAGLKKYLRKEYENLLTVEVVCHGVPSPKVWRDYLQYRKSRALRVVGKNSVSYSLNELPVITGISFRDKSNGWKKFGFKIAYAASEAAENTVSKSPVYELTPFDEDLFMRGFLKNLYLRPSCYHCPARQGKSGADISIADYWGVQNFHPQMDDDKGTGLVLVNTPAGARYYSLLNDKIENKESEYAKAIKSNSCIVRSVKEPKYRKEFWKLYETAGIDAIAPICSKIKPSAIARCKNIIKKIIKRIIQK